MESSWTIQTLVKNSQAKQLDNGKETLLNYDVFLKGIAYAYLYKSSETYVDEIELEDVTLTFIRQRRPVKLFKKLKAEKFIIEEKWKGIYYISKEGTIRIQIIVSKELSLKNHIWMNSLSEKISLKQATELINVTQELEQLDDKNYADSLWEIVATVNEQIIEKAMEEERMCEALARIMKPEIDKIVNKAVEDGFNDGFNDGVGNGKMEVFKNMIKNGVSRELAQKCAELSDELVEKALKEIV